MFGTIYRAVTGRPFVFSFALGVLTYWVFLREDKSCNTASPRNGNPFASTNPWRQLPTDDATDQQLRELFFISEVIGKFHTVPLPDDDFALYDKCLRSLETRNDMLWVSYHALDFPQAVSRMGNVKTAHMPNEEAVRLQERGRALSSYWHELELSPQSLDMWLEACDTTVIPPLIRGDDVEPVAGIEALGATEEQISINNALYESWRDEREDKVSYLKDHPPRPMGFAPKRRDQVGRQEAWDSLPGVEVMGGRPVPMEMLDGNTRWKPLYSTLLVTAPVPLGWENPDRREPTSDDEVKALKQREEIWNQNWEKTMARQKEQKEYIKKAKEAERSEIPAQLL